MKAVIGTLCSTLAITVIYWAVVSRGALAGAISRSTQCSTTAVTKTVVCVILSVG